MTENTPEMPIKWITREVRKYLTKDQYKELMVDLNRVKRLYDLNTKLRSAKSQLNQYRRAQRTYTEGTERWRHYALMVESKLMRIERLGKEIGEIDENNESTVS